jgi:hypothetical protein
MITAYLLVFLTSSTPTPAGSSKAVGASVMGCLMQPDVRCAVALFHFPETYTVEDQKKDSLVVSEHLTRYLRVFGTPREAPHGIPKAIRFVSVGGGSIAYWKSRKAGVTITYPVDFSNVGDGVVIVHCFRTAQGWQVRDVAFGMSADRLDAGRILDCAEVRATCKGP